MLAKLSGKFPGAPGTATPQEKILAVSEGLGIQGMEIMQATTRTIYDSLPVDGRTVFEFFKGCNSRAFPFTNLPANRLEVGEAMIIEYMSLQFLTSAVQGVGPVTATGTLGTTSTSYYASDFSFNVANVTTLKPISLGQMDARFNKDAKFATNDSYHFLSMLTIPELQQFVATLQTTDATARGTLTLKLTLEGIGVIYRPKRAL